MHLACIIIDTYAWEDVKALKSNVSLILRKKKELRYAAACMLVHVRNNRIL